MAVREPPTGAKPARAFAEPVIPDAPLPNALQAARIRSEHRYRCTGTGAMFRSEDMSFVRLKVNDDDAGAAIQILADQFCLMHVVDSSSQAPDAKEAARLKRTRGKPRCARQHGAENREL